MALTGAALTNWANSTSDTRALEDFNGATSRVAAAWCSPSSFSFALNLTDGNPHSVSVYMLAFTGAATNQGVRITDANTGAVLDQEYANSGWAFGRYWSWTLQGNVIVTVVNNGGVNAVASGLFFNN